MNRVRFLVKIAMLVSIFATLTFTVSCSSDKDDKGSDGKWCVIGQGEGQRCAEIGARYKADMDPNQQKMTEAVCNFYGENASIQKEKPSDCIVITE